MPHNVLILGNGFDLDIGFKTKYSDFVNSSNWPFKEKDLSAIGVPNLQNYIYDFTEKYKDELGNVRWIDIEQLLKDYAITKNEPNSYNNDMVKADKQCFKRIETAYAKYLKEQLYQGRPSHFFKASYELVDAISKSSKEWVGYTFNYTDSSAIIDLIAQDNYTSFLSIPFTHLHGQIDMYGYDDTLILGIDDAVSIPKEYKFLRKTWNPNYDSHKLDEDLFMAENIICFGWSFGEIDREYLRDFFQELNNVPEARERKRGLHFITYDDKSRIDIMDNLEAIGAQMSRLKKYTDIDFYLTSELGTQREMDRFKALCDMLSK